VTELPAAVSITRCGAPGSDTSSSGGNGSVEKAKIITGASGQATLTKLIAGEAGIAFASYVPFFVAQAKGSGDVKFVADSVSASANSTLIVTKPDSSVKNVKDLVGKKVGLAATGTDCDLMTKSIMKANAVEFNDVTWVQVPFPDMAAALSRDEVDADCLPEPFITQDATSVGASAGPAGGVRHPQAAHRRQPDDRCTGRCFLT
jgi:TRAP-type uncharacterized transport system substrate-binding protein